MWVAVVGSGVLLWACGRSGEITLGEYVLPVGQGGEDASSGTFGGLAEHEGGSSAESGGTTGTGGTGNSAPVSAGTPSQGGSPNAGSPNAGSPNGGQTAERPDENEAGEGFFWTETSGFSGYQPCAALLECDGISPGSGLDPGTVCRRNFKGCSADETVKSCRDLANTECLNGVVEPIWVDPVWADP